LYWALLNLPGLRCGGHATQHDPFKNGKLGPPFSVTEADVSTLFPPAHYGIELLKREDRMPIETVWRDRGCNYFFEATYLITKKR
jgi:hypothetical protein